MSEMPVLRPCNQGSHIREAPSAIRRDSLLLTNKEEERVYAVLRAVQEALPDQDSLLIAPLPAVKLRGMGRPLVPDFLITYRGRAGVIEVDGPRHHGRWGADMSRDRRLWHAGIRHVEHILVEDLAIREDVEKLIRDFLWRMTAL